MIYYDGHPFHSEEDVEDYKVRKAQRERNLSRESDRLAGLYFRGTSGVRASLLSPADIVFMAHAETLPRTNRADLFQAILVGTLSDINAARNGIHRTDVQEVLGRYRANPAAFLDKYRNPALENAVAAFLHPITPPSDRG